MTPLAHHIAKTGEAFRNDDFAARFLSAHFFECTDLLPIVEELWNKSLKASSALDLAFLPFPKTWLECKTEIGRVAFFIEQKKRGLAEVRVIQLSANGKALLSSPEEMYLIDEYTKPTRRMLAQWNTIRLPPQENLLIAATAFLICINSPKIIGRRMHAPHRGLEKQLLKQRPQIMGQHPLKVWTEVKLEVAAPREATPGDGGEVHFTGDRALHWVRAFTRIRFGRLELVKAHQRGNAHLGIKQTRYRVTALECPV